MITNVRSDRMVVISDLHLGNPFSNAKDRVIHFLSWALANKYDVCINGDGLEIAQASFSKIALEVPQILSAIRRATDNGQKVYYVIGNHDIVLEHFLDDWGAVKVSPFLNISSGDKRIRVEHGHIYDPFFVRFPLLYEFGTLVGGIFLRLSPNLYRIWIQFERWRFRKSKRKSGITGEHPNFASAAQEISRRGFDAVIFGHTHHPGERALEFGGMYYNPGSWMRESHYIAIESGNVSLNRFENETKR